MVMDMPELCHFKAHIQESHQRIPHSSEWFRNDNEEIGPWLCYES